MERGKKKERKEEYELDEASECVSSYISEGRKNELSSPTFSPLFCHVLSSVMSSLLFIYPSTWTQRRDTEFANLLFAIWVCRTLTTTKLSPGKPRINDNATANNDNHYHRYRGNIQGNFLVRKGIRFNTFDPGKTGSELIDDRSSCKYHLVYRFFCQFLLRVLWTLRGNGWRVF